MDGLLLLIVGPSGVGKGTVISRLKKRHSEYVFPVSCTTRNIRPGEKEGEVYNYISKKEFKKGIEKGDFLEYAIVHNDNYYGTVKKPIMDALENGKVVVRELDIQGFESIKKRFPKENVVSIFIYVSDWDALKKRIMKRCPESEEELEQRHESYLKEMAKKELCDYEIESKEGKVQECLEEIEEIIINHQ